MSAKLGDWYFYDKQFRYMRQSAPDLYPWVMLFIGNYGYTRS